MKYRILIVDDEPLVRSSLRRLLDHQDWAVLDVASGAAALDEVGRTRFDVAIIDYRIGDLTGLEVLDGIRASSPGTECIMLTAHGNVAVAVEALKKGAYDFLEKDADPKLTRHVVEKALDRVRLRREIEELRRERLSRADLPQIISRSASMAEALAMADRFARTDATVLIEGETGVGKSLLAEFVHYASDRSGGRFVTINCGAIPKELIESELFGYADGAFTGARAKGKAGLVGQADGGTLFLDEIGDLSLELQSKILHVLEKREFLSVGAVEPTRVDVRFIAATNVDLARRIAEDRFRRDLFYRLNVAPIHLAPLRKRKEDILPLARHFTQKLSDQYGKAVIALSPDAERHLVEQPWPGNVRELRNTLERVILLKQDDSIDASDLQLNQSRSAQATPGRYRLEVAFDSGEDLLDAVTRDLVTQAWERSGYNQTQAARLLGIPRTTFQTYVQKFQLDRALVSP
jgi:two-component system, NtrC family, response regulator AtoC